MLGIEGQSESGLTQGIGFNITFEGIPEDKGFESQAFKEWREQVTEIVLRHKDAVFDVAKGEENARQMTSEIIATSNAKGVVVANDADVPAIQVSGVDPKNNKAGKKLDINFSAADDAPTSIVSTDYKTRRPQEVNGEGTGGIGLPAKRPFEFIGRVIAL